MKILVILLWPAGVALIVGTGALLARRARQAEPADGRGPRRGRRGRRAGSPPTAERMALGAAILVGGLVVVYAITALVGLLIVHNGPAIDKPIFRWLAANRVHWWKDVMFIATQFGLKWTTWGVAAVAGLALALVWREKRWLPPVVMFALIVLDHYLVRALTHTIHRVPPPGSRGTFPSGGCDRVIVFYGLIAYLIWWERSGRRATAFWAAAIVAALGFNEAYSRVYLGFHWFTDTLGGLLCGSAELVVFVLAVRAIAGPARRVQAREPPQPRAQPGRVTPGEGDADLRAPPGRDTGVRTPSGGDAAG